MATIEQNLQTIANGIDTIKDNLGLSESASLSDVVTKSASVIEPTGTINITENGTVDVTNYASASVEVSGGGTATDYTELMTKMNGVSENFIAYAKSLPNNYTAATSSPVTLYTPNSEYKYYVIQKRSSGKCRIVWFKDIAAVHVNGSNLTFGKTSLTAYFNSTDIAPIFTTLSGSEGNTTGYYSSEYSTAAEIVEKMQNNEITYTFTTNSFLGVKDGDNIAPFSNAPIYNDATLKFETNLTKISSNETISIPPRTDLEYIQSSGTQYINTNIAANTIGRIVTKFYIVSLDGYRAALGASSSTTAFNSSTLGIGLTTPENQNGFWRSAKLLTYSFSAGNLYDIDFTTKSGAQRIVVNGTTYTNNNTGTVTYKPVFLFTMGYSGNVKTTEISSIRLYRTQIYDTSDVLIRDFIPVKDPDNVVCLFDAVTETYFYNLGSGTFEAGPEV